MISPVTVATFLMACGSGLYLYQSKHDVQLMDRQIERTVRETSTLREQSRLLAAEWTMLNDPERLRQFSDSYLGLKPIAPQQFTSLADLNGRLPDIQTASSAEAPQASQDTPAAVPEPAGPAIAREMQPINAAPVSPSPVSPPPVSPPVSAQAVSAAATRTLDKPAPRPALEAQTKQDTRPVETRAAEPRSLPEVRVADVHPAEPRPAPRVAETRPAALVAAVSAVPRPVAMVTPHPTPVYAPVPVSAPAPAPMPVQQQPRPAMVAVAAPAYSGSLLGVARGSASSVPRPTPIGSSYNAN